MEEEVDEALEVEMVDFVGLALVEEELFEEVEAALPDVVLLLTAEDVEEVDNVVVGVVVTLATFVFVVEMGTPDDVVAAGVAVVVDGCNQKRGKEEEKKKKKRLRTRGTEESLEM